MVSKNKKRANIIIPIAGLSSRMKNNIPKCLTKLNDNETILSRQIRIIKQVYSNPNIILVAGYKIDKIEEAISKEKGIVLIENKFYEFSNVGQSIANGLVYCLDKLPTVIVYGDLVFNKEALTCLPLCSPSLLIDSYNKNRDKEVGISFSSGIATNLSYGINDKWAQITVLDSKSRKEWIDFSNNWYAQKYYGFEIINHIMNTCEFNIVQNDKMKLVEVDAIGDMEEAKLIR